MQEAQKVEPTPERQEAKQMTEKNMPEPPVSQPRKTPDSRQPAVKTEPAPVQQKAKKKIASAEKTRNLFIPFRSGYLKRRQMPPHL